jgi:hypothetical protein
MAEVVPFAIVVAVLAVAGVAIGRLVAPAITRWSERDEEPGDDPNDSSDSRDAG